MILVDTSVWVSHFRRNNPRLEDLLIIEDVSCHPFIIGELACGNLHNRNEILMLLEELPQVTLLSDQEVLMFIEKHHLMGKGLSLIDIHLLGSAFISNSLLWTEDKALFRFSKELNLTQS